MHEAYNLIAPPQLIKRLIEIVGVDILLAEHKMQRQNPMPALAFPHIKKLYPILGQVERICLRGKADGRIDAKPSRIHAISM